MDPSLTIPTDVRTISYLAVSIGFFHTLLGPDHYIPFVAMSRVGGWSWRKTIAVTMLCGFGHVGGSVVLGLIGVAMGLVVRQLEAVETVRGGLASWLLIVFGSAYFLWGLRQAFSNKPHTHLQLGPAGATTWQHAHDSGQAHRLPAEQSVPAPRDAGAAAAPVTSMTPWVLMIIFVLGPCESLIVVLMYPAAQANALAVVWVTSLFGAATLITMTTMVIMMRLGTQAVSLGRFHQYSHAVAGFAILASGLAVKLGL
jgi:nickel/cobalt transporter (NicO) family protein